MSGPIVRKWTGLGSLGPYFLSDILVQNYKLRLIDEYYNYNTNTFNTIISDQNIGPQIGQKYKQTDSIYGLSGSGCNFQGWKLNILSKRSISNEKCDFDRFELTKSPCRDQFVLQAAPSSEPSTQLERFYKVQTWLFKVLYDVFNHLLPKFKFHSFKKFWRRRVFWLNLPLTSTIRQYFKKLQNVQFQHSAKKVPKYPG